MSEKIIVKLHSLSTMDKEIDEKKENPNFIFNSPLGDIECSDGYHTFDELYEHRIVLFISLCRHLKKYDDFLYPVWCSVLHSDGSKFDDWFILGIRKEKGEQITYHLPVRYWSEVCEFAEVLEKAPEYDGHTPADVLERMKIL